MDQVSLHEYCDEAGSLIQSGEFDKAIRITRHILRHYPRHVESYRRLGEALLKAGDYQEAARQFWRVLGADPEDVTARVGLATICEAAGDLDKAAAHMQRACDLSPGDSDLRAQVRRLSDARQGETAEPFEITRAALGRIYARGGLHAKAIQEFEAVLAQEPDRSDVQVALAAVLWRTGRRLEAAEVCHRILEKLPNALKANLIVGAVRLDSHQPDEAVSYLQLAQGLDPENIVAQSLFGEKLPLSPLTIKIDRLGEVEMEEAWLKPPPAAPVEGGPPQQREEPATDWMSKWHEEEAAPMSDKERADEEFELPDWLRGVGDDLLEEEDGQATASVSTPSPRPVPSAGYSTETEDETPAWLHDLVARTEEPPEGKKPRISDEMPSAAPGDVPDWLQELRPEVPEEALPASEAPDWLAAIAAGGTLDETQPEGAQLDWLSEQGESGAQPVPSEAPAEPVAEADEGRALWEQILAEEGVDLTSAQEARPPEAEGMTAEEWLRSTSDQTRMRPATVSPAPTATPPKEEVPEEVPAAPVAAEEEVEQVGHPAWLEEVKAPEPAAEAAQKEAGLPDWLRAEYLPSEEKAEAPPLAGESEPSVLEPMGGIVGETEIPDWLREIAAGEPATTPEAVTPTFPQVPVDEAGLPDWLRQVAAGEPVPAEEEGPVAPVTEAETPVWSYAAHEVEEIAGPLPEVAEPWPVEKEEVEAEAVGLPDWLREVQEPQPEVEVSPGLAREYPEAEVEEEELPDWLRTTTAGAAEDEVGLAAEVPDWLKVLESEEVPLTELAFDKPIELESGEMPAWLGEVMAEEPPLAEGWAEPGEEEMRGERVPGWLRGIREGEKEAAAEPAAEAVEAEAPPAEEVGEVQPELPDWLRSLREGAEEAPPAMPEYLPGPPEEEVTVMEAEVPPAEALAAPEAVGAEKGLVELEAVEEEVAPAPGKAIEMAEVELPPAALPEAKPRPVPPTVERAVTRHLEPLRPGDLPKDPAARLQMARAALNAGDWTEALVIYETLVTSSDLLDEVISNLEQGVKAHPDDPAGYQLLGDACMKDGRLQDALRSYRTALAKL